MKTDRIYPAMDHLNKIFTMTWAKYHADEIIGKTIVNQYDCDPETLKKGKKLGQGGYGTATLVRIKELAAEVVAKRFGKINNETITLINGELECLIRMQSHPHIVHIYGYLVKNGDYEGIIMEYCHGGDLHSVIKKPETNIDEAKVLNWTRQAACGLMYLHQNKIIHRDVKPENMFLNSDRSILKLGDFGLIKFLPESVDKKSYEGELQSIFGLKRDVDNHTVSHEQHGRAIAVELSQDVGTYGFQAPEIENGDFYTTVVDVYSLGRSMWYMIFGQLFEGTTQKLMDKLKAATLGESSNPLVPSFEPSNQLNELVLNMMLQDQFKRPSMEMVYETLSVWMDQRSTQMATVEQN